MRTVRNEDGYSVNLKLGIKSDPIEYRYTFDWLFDLMKGLEVERLQLGSFLELYGLEDAYFVQLRRRAENRGIHIKSCFTSHRELGGFFTGDPHLERCARRYYERYIRVASVIGADYMGGSAGFVYRDKMDHKEEGIACYLRHMRELTAVARDAGLQALTAEPMSSLAEPPSTPGEIDAMIGPLEEHHRRNPDTTVPFYLCGDVSHGLADERGRVLVDNMQLFEHALPHMVEFHFKNTDAIFDSTFGFGDDDMARGRVDLPALNRLLQKNCERFPVDEVVGYLEIGGPKVGRDYSDPLLERQLVDSIQNLKKHIAFS